MLTDGAATSATGSSPVFSSASYNFVSGDIGAWVYIASGTNWTPGWYKIASVASNQATLSAAAGAAVLATTNGPTTAAGCATTASPTGATWTIDYSQQASPQITYTDLVIAATTTNLTSVAHPFGKQMVGNILNITGGSGFTTGWYTLQSVNLTGFVGTFDRAVGTAASVSGAGKLGGAMATLATNLIKSSSALAVAGNLIWLVGTLTVSATAATFAVNSGYLRIGLFGYGSVRGDGTQATITTSTNSIHGLSFGACFGVECRWLNVTSTAGSPGDGIRCTGSSNAQQVILRNCTFSGWNLGFNGNNGSSIWLIDFLYCFQCIWKSNASHGFDNAGRTVIIGCYAKANGGDGFRIESNSSASLWADTCVASGNTGSGFNDQSTSTSKGFGMKNCVAYNNTADGVKVGHASSDQDLVIINTICYGNGGFGIDLVSISSGALPMTVLLQMNNFFGSNTSGARNSGSPVGDNDVTLSGNPFNNPSSDDFSLNSTAGAGAACTGAGWQPSTIV